jgi:hypothetical protein
MKMLGKKPPLPQATDVQGELHRIRAHINEVSLRLSDSDLDFSESVRLSVELRELEAYVRGILFATGRASAWD